MIPNPGNHANPINHSSDSVYGRRYGEGAEILFILPILLMVFPLLAPGGN